MLKQLRIRSRGNTHVWVDHPLLRGIIPGDGKVRSGQLYDVPTGHMIHEIDEREARQSFAGCHLHVDFIGDEDDPGDSATPDEGLIAENEALKARLEKMERSRDYYKGKRDKLRKQLKKQETEPEDGDDDDDPDDDE